MTCDNILALSHIAKYEVYKFKNACSEEEAQTIGLYRYIKVPM